MNRSECPICNQRTRPIGSRSGVLDASQYLFRRCEACRFSYVQNIREDYTTIYNEDYYRGNGADRLADYIGELNLGERSIRNYEWEGLLKIYRGLCPGGGRWLDFGCGVGGLVRYATARGVEIIGADDGWGSFYGKQLGVDVKSLKDLSAELGSFKFISAVEVLEHVAEPLATLRQIASLLAPGGILFVTTGNAEPFKNKILTWSYASVPEVHISFFEPHTMEFCLQSVGMRAMPGSQLDGFTDIMKYKVLKNLGIKKRNPIWDALPWRWISRLVDYRYQISAMPFGVKEPSGAP